MKKKECEEQQIPFDGEIYLWDYRYYDRKYMEETLSLDEMLVKEYFPVSVVVPTILSIYENLLGVRFEALKEASLWHPGWLTYCSTLTLTYITADVQAFAVWDKGVKDEMSFLGYCYLDLFPRSLYLSLVSDPRLL
jgi:Zn-dependent oligopeptidase